MWRVQVVMAADELTCEHAGCWSRGSKLSTNYTCTLSSICAARNVTGGSPTSLLRTTKPGGVVLVTRMIHALGVPLQLR